MISVSTREVRGSGFQVSVSGAVNINGVGGDDKVEGIEGKMVSINLQFVKQTFNMILVVGVMYRIMLGESYPR